MFNGLDSFLGRIMEEIYRMGTQQSIANGGYVTRRSPSHVRDRAVPIVFGTSSCCLASSRTLFGVEF